MSKFFFFRKTFFCFLASIAFCGLIEAQTTPIQIGQIGFERNFSTLYVPILRASTTDLGRFNRSRTVYTEAELQQIGVFPGHIITKISFEKHSGGTLPNNPLALSVWMYNGSVSGNNVFEQNIANASLVYTDSNKVVLDTVAWFDIELDSVFVYNGGDLFVFFESGIYGNAPFSTDAFLWYYSGNWNMSNGTSTATLPFPTGVQMAGSMLTGYRPNTRFEFQSPATNDIAIKRFISPIKECAGFTNVEIEIQNVGSSSVDSIEISWLVNGVLQSSFLHSSPLSSGDSVNISLGVFIANHDSIYEIIAYVANGAALNDGFSQNDTLTLVYQSALFGGYTINSTLPTGGNNFQSINDAAQALGERGVCGPVGMVVALNTGPYIGRVVINEIPGADSTKSITIIGNNNTLLHTGFNPALELNGAKHITFRNLNVEMTGLNSAALFLTNDASYNFFENCTFSMQNTFQNAFGVLFAASNQGTNGSLAGDFNTFLGCKIIGGGTGVRLFGAAAHLRSQGNKFIDCEIIDFGGSGIRATHNEDMLVRNCIINRKTLSSQGNSANGVLFEGDMRGALVEKNKIHDLLLGGSNTTSIGFSCEGTGNVDKPIVFRNNLLYNFLNNGNIRGISIRANANHIELFHNTVSIDNMSFVGNSTVNGLFNDNSITHLKVQNNLFFIQTSTLGQNTVLRINSTSPNVISDHNAFYLGSAGFIGHTGTAMYPTLAGWQTGTSRDLNSVFANPLFVSIPLENFTPSSPLINDIGDSLGIVDDFFGVMRSPNTPDPGAIEFTPFTRDLRLSSTSIKQDPCLLGNDSIFIEIENIIGPTIAFSSEPITANWIIQGPVNSTGSLVFNTGSLALNDKAERFSLSIDLSTPGSYDVLVYLDSNDANQNLLNDTIRISSFVVEPIFWIDPKIDSVFDDTSTVRLQAFSPFIPTGSVIITEITQNRVGSFSPVNGWPSYLISNNYIELFGPANEDISGYSLEIWDNQSLLSDYTFPTGTVLSPQGTAIIATSLLHGTVESPSDFYYHGTNLPSFFLGSQSISGRVLKNAEGVIVDALGYSTHMQVPYVFPDSADVPYYHWNPFVNNFFHTGKMLSGPDKNSSENWIPFNIWVNRPSPNVPNPNVPQPVVNTTNVVSWTVNGTPAGSGDVFHAGPFTKPGVYEVVATYPFTVSCGTLSDTAYIIVDFPYCYDLDSLEVVAGCETLSIDWFSENDFKNTVVEYGPAGFALGSGTRLFNVQAPLHLSNIQGEQEYDVYVIDSCKTIDPLTNDTVLFDAVMIQMTNVFVPSFPQVGSVHYQDDGVGGYLFWLTGNAGPITWNFGDGTILSGDSVAHTYVRRGVYTIWVVAENVCGVDSFLIEFKHVKINSFAAESLRVFPNPSNDGVFNVVNIPFTDAYSIRLFDGFGKVIYSQVDQTLHSLRMDLGHLPSGVYTLVLSNSEGEINKKLIIMR